MSTPAPADSEIVAAMAAQPTGRWELLFAAADELARTPEPFTWQKPHRGSDGVVQVGYPVCSEAAEAVRGLLVELQVMVVFDWMAWEGAGRYPGGRGLMDAPVADAARLTTTIIRGERFSDGTIAQAITDGTLQAIIQRLRTWYARALKQSVQPHDESLQLWVVGRIPTEPALKRAQAPYGGGPALDGRQQYPERGRHEEVLIGQTMR